MASRICLRASGSAHRSHSPRWGAAAGTDTCVIVTSLANRSRPGWEVCSVTLSSKDKEACAEDWRIDKKAWVISHGGGCRSTTSLCPHGRWSSGCLPGRWVFRDGCSRDAISQSISHLHSEVPPVSAVDRLLNASKRSMQDYWINRDPWSFVHDDPIPRHFFFLFRFTCNFIAGTSCDRCYVRLTFPHDYWCLQSKKWSLFSQKRREGNETIFVPTETQSSKPTYHIFIFFQGIEWADQFIMGLRGRACGL